MARKIDASEPLNRLLRDLQLTQEEFARGADIGLVTANRWVNGKVLVDERKLAKAFAAFGVDGSKYGVDLPEPASEPPPWFVAFQEDARRRHEEVMAGQRAILIAIGALQP